MRLRVWGYTNGEYINLLNDRSLTLKYKNIHTKVTVQRALIIKKRTDVNKGVWHLGKGQRGGFFLLAGPLLGAVAGPVLEKVAASLLAGVFKKIVGHGSCRRRKRRFRCRRF